MIYILKKLLTFFILLRYPKVPGQYRWFIRFRYLGRLRQLRYIINDYIIRKPYKVILCKSEFQEELLHVIPFAYWHFKNGTLEETISSHFTKELYFFSKHHKEREGVRHFEDNFNLEIPNAPHDFKLNTSKWTPVPFKEYYQNDVFIYDKPMLVIANRYNTEWNRPPISYLSLDILDKLFSLLKTEYQIIYNRPPAEWIINDNSEVKELDDYKWIKDYYPETIQVVDLYNEKKPSIGNYNHLQLLVYANCTNFVSVHGGTATLASCFGGKNIIYSKRGHEHYFGEFENIFPLLSGAEIIHAKDYESLLTVVSNAYISQ